MSEEFYKNNWNDFVLVLNDFKLTHIENRHWEGNIWYFFGTSDFFDKNVEGEAISEYGIIFTRDREDKKESKITYKFEKIS